ncbi:MAG: zinc ribbon domain-containing protein [Propionibacteriaceae bacterium]|jgi:hypothetical protein|nr:zinc ribbon domain-containing protein [Propionibacteriaceae bacterium]
MTSDIFGGLGGLMKGLSGFMPQDDPNTKLFNAQSELTDLNRQADAAYIEIGKAAYGQNPGQWPQNDKLKLILANIAAAEAKRDELDRQKKAVESENAAKDAAATCSDCGHRNLEGVKFCQECGSPLTSGSPKHCVGCGVELAAGARFCGSCGAQQGN